jgi:hypothetical protein
MKPSQGRIVIFHQPDYEVPCNGSREHPAIVNCVWPSMGGDGGINCTVFPDCAAPRRLSAGDYRSARGQPPSRKGGAPGGPWF